MHCLLKSVLNLTRPIITLWEKLQNQIRRTCSILFTESSQGNVMPSISISIPNSESQKSSQKSSKSGTLLTKMTNKDCFKAMKMISLSTKKKPLSLTVLEEASKRLKSRKPISTKLQNVRSLSNQNTSKSILIWLIHKEKAFLSMDRPREVLNLEVFLQVPKLGEQLWVEMTI